MARRLNKSQKNKKTETAKDKSVISRQISKRQKKRVKTISIELKAQKSKPFVKNLSNTQLSNIELVALGRGLNFIPTPQKPKRSTILRHSRSFFRKMRLRLKIAGRVRPSHVDPFRLPSTWNPQPTFNPNLDTYIEGTLEELSRIEIKHVQSNITKAERIALTGLGNRQDIVIKPFDKGRGICVLNKLDYINEGIRQLSGSHYEEVDGDRTGETAKLVAQAIHKLHMDKIISKQTLEYLNHDNTDIRTPCLYLLPKVHKKAPEGTRFVGRPIISGCKGPTQSISKYMDYFLLPIVKQQSTYKRDSAHVLEKLNTLTVKRNSLLIALDIVSMYTNCLQDEAIESVCDALDEANSGLYTIPKPTKEHARCLLELIMKRNIFEFNGRFYRQKIGVAMGSECSPEVCDITLFKYEKDIILPRNPSIKCYMRYRDDVLIVFEGSEDKAVELIHTLNQIHPTLKFTSEISHNQVTFLDLIIYKGERFRREGKLDTRVATKKTDTFQYLARDSAHPESVFGGLIKGEVTRYSRICTHASDFEEKVNFFRDKLQQRGYNEKDLASLRNKSETRVEPYERTKTTKKEIPLVFTLPYHPHIKHLALKRALQKHWNLINGNEFLNELFPTINPSLPVMFLVSLPLY